MKKIFLFLIIIIAVVAGSLIVYNDKISSLASAFSLQNNIEIEEMSVVFPSPEHTIYNMSLYLDHINLMLYGKTVLYTKNTSGQELDKLYFTAYPNTFKKSSQSPAPLSAYYNGFNEGWMKIDELKVNGEEVKYNKEDVSIEVLLDSIIAKDEDILIEIVWQTKIPRVAYRFGYNDEVFMLGNFYPTLDVLSEKGWHISYNSMFGDPFCFHSADYIVTLNVSENYNVIASGIEVKRVAEDNGREKYLFQAEKVRDFCLVLAYDYGWINKESHGVNIKIYAPSKHMKKAREVLEMSAEVLHFYSSLFGSYPYPEFKIVFVPMKGFHGMEYSGLIFLREEFLLPNYDKSRSDFILSHEIAHQWWYSMVGNDQIREPWLDEGLANWSAYKYLEKYQGRQIPKQNLFPEGINLSRELRDIYSTQEYYLTAYNGGEAFWFGLEDELGEEVVKNVLRRYLADYKYEIASTQDLLKTIEKETDKDLSEYFALWSLVE